MKATEGKGDVNSRVQSFLLQYRGAGIRDGASPAERISHIRQRFRMCYAVQETLCYFSRLKAIRFRMFLELSCQQLDRAVSTFLIRFLTRFMFVLGTK